MLLVLVLAIASTSLKADTVAWWRFDNDGFNEGQSPALNADVVRDETGNNSGRTTRVPIYASQVPFDKLNSGNGTSDNGISTNKLSLRMSNAKKWEDVFIMKKPVCSIRLPAYTIELSFRCSDIAMFRAVLCKDGKPTEAPSPSFVAKLSPRDSKLYIETLDESGQLRRVGSRVAIETDVWYNIAVVNDGKQLVLYLKKASSDTYELQAKVHVEGGLIDSPGIWAIGRGMSDGKLADPFYGYVDEIRISDTALSLENFLTAANH